MILSIEPIKDKSPVTVLTHLYSIGGTLVRYVSRVALGDAGEHGGCWQALVGGPSCLHPRHPGGLDADCHVGEHECHRLVLRDRSVERLALHRVVRRFIQSSLS